MDIEQRIPDLTDKDLERLHANAVRLAQAGTVKQRGQAEALLPLLGVALEARKAARAETQKQARRVNGRRKAGASVKA